MTQPEYDLGLTVQARRCANGETMQYKLVLTVPSQRGYPIATVASFFASEPVSREAAARRLLRLAATGAEA